MSSQATREILGRPAIMAKSVEKYAEWQWEQKKGAGKLLKAAVRHRFFLKHTKHQEDRMIHLTPHAGNGGAKECLPLEST